MPTVRYRPGAGDQPKYRQGDHVSNDERPKVGKIEKATRFGCGALLGFFVGLYFIMRPVPQKKWVAVPLVLSTLSAGATPPPPPPPPQVREARMTVTIKMVEASHGSVTKITDLCKVSGKIPVYADAGGATRFNGREILGCGMLWKGQSLHVSVRGAVGVARGPVTFAFASVGIVLPDAVSLCQEMCGPQPLADSSGEIRIYGKPRSIQFSLTPNPVSLLNAKPTVWLEAEVMAESRGRTL